MIRVKTEEVMGDEVHVLDLPQILPTEICDTADSKGYSSLLEAGR